MTSCPFCNDEFDGLPALAYHLSRGCIPMSVNRDRYVRMVEKRERERRFIEEDRRIYQENKRNR